MFLKNRWYVAALSKELREDQPLGRVICGEPVVFYRNLNGSPIALEDRCCHRQTKLSLGTIEGNDLRCRYHGLKFNSDGTLIEIPSQKSIPEGAGVKAYPVIEDQNYIHIFIGEPSGANLQSHYRHENLSMPHWTSMQAQFSAKCSWRLLVDNLMDFTHVPWSHKNTIGASGLEATNEQKTERDHDEHVRLSRILRNIDPAPAHIKAFGYNGKVDRWQIVDFAPPSYMALTVGVAKAGTGMKSASGENLMLDRRTLHIATPETEATTHYFWTTMHERGSLTDDQEQLIYDQSVETFHEDLLILEAQQERYTDDIPRVDLAADTALFQVRRVLDRLIGEQAQA
jgi:phenylpropionate dioxygenase-like ring-hydroxylating dioxygenase large terminal subunit